MEINNKCAFSAYYNNNLSVNPSKTNSTENHSLLMISQIPLTLNSNSISSQSTALKESLSPIFVASEQGLDASA